MDYISLVDDLNKFLARNDTSFKTSIDEFISQAIYRINRELFIPEQISTVNDNLVIDTNIVAKPNNTNKIIRIFTVATPIPVEAERVWYELIIRERALLLTFFPKMASNPLVDPEFYCEGPNDSIEVYPYPSSASLLRITFLEKIPELTQDSPTNILTEKYQNLIKYAALLEAAPFLMNDARIPVWESYYKNSAATLQVPSKSL